MEIESTLATRAVCQRVDAESDSLPSRAGQRLVSALIIGNCVSAWQDSRGVCEELADQLRTRNVRVYIASRHRHAFRRLPDMLMTVWRNRAEFEVAQVDVLSGRAFVWSEAVCALLNKLNKPYILSLHGGNLPEFSARFPHRVEKLLSSAAAVTAPSKYLCERMSAYCSRLILLPNPITIDGYDFRWRVAARPQLVWLRAFHAIYNPSLAVKIVKLLQPVFPQVSLTMVGSDKEDGSRRAVESLVDELQLAKNVKLVNGIPKAEVPQMLSTAGDVFINTTNIDNTPISVMEAMASGLCIVSTNVGGIPYLLEDETDALLVPPDDADAMARAVRRILTEPELAKRLSNNARLKVEGFAWEKLLPQWEDLMSVVARHGKTT